MDDIREVMVLTNNFMLHEFLHEGVDCIPLDVLGNLVELANNLQVLRDEIEDPLYANSGYRTPEYNAKLPNSSKNSQHILGKAADIWCKKLSAHQLYLTIERLIRIGKMKQGGLGLYNTFVHYDIRGHRARWDYRSKKI